MSEEKVDVKAANIAKCQAKKLLRRKKRKAENLKLRGSLLGVCPVNVSLAVPVDIAFQQGLYLARETLTLVR